MNKITPSSLVKLSILTSIGLFVAIGGLVESVGSTSSTTVTVESNDFQKHSTQELQPQIAQVINDESRLDEACSYW